MSELFLKILNMSFVASWLILAVILLRLALKKAQKWITCLLWGMVAVRLLCPMSFESSLSLIPNAEPITQDILMMEPPDIHEAPAFDPVVNPNLPDVAPITPDTSIDQIQIKTMLATFAWVIGMGVMHAYATVSYLHLRYKVRASLHLRDNIWLCDEIATPFLLGVFRSKIYIPSGINESSLPPIIAHENAHLKRRDHWWKPLGFLILTIHWFNPLVWLAYILLCRDIELACDEKVIKGWGKEESIAYSEALLSCSVSRRTILVCPLAFGEVGVKERVKRVLNYKKPAFWIVVVAIVISMVLAICFLTNPHSFPVDLASIQISAASTLDLRTNSGPIIRQLSAAETEELSSRLKDLRVRQKDQDFQGQTPFYSLYVDTMEQGQITFSGFNDDGTHTAVLYDNVYYRISNSDFIEYLQRICAGGSRSAAASSPFGRTYHVYEIAYSDPVYDFAYTSETASLYELTGDQGLLICENKNDMIWLNAGTFREITLGEDFAACFRDLDNMGWNNTDSGTLVEENQQAWQLAVADQAENTVIYNLLLQKNGDIYLTYGYGGATNSGSTELLSIRWVFKLAEGLEAAPTSDKPLEVIDASLDEIRETENIHAVYDFPEPTYHVVVNYEGAGKSETFEFGTEKYSEDNILKTAPILEWFYALEIQPEGISTEDIEPVEGNEVFTFVVNGNEAFFYDNRGGNEAYLCVDGKYYVVDNPSDLIA